MSGYRFVRAAAARGIPVGIVTRGSTRGDGEASLRVDAALAPTLGGARGRSGVSEFDVLVSILLTRGGCSRPVAEVDGPEQLRASRLASLSVLPLG